MRRAKSVAFLLASSFVAACSSAGGSPDGGSQTPATPQQVKDCEASCDSQKLFGCNDALDQATCYADCKTATGDQIDLFNGCVRTAICDPSCSTHIQPNSPPPPDGGSNTCAGSCDGGLATDASGDPAAECKQGCQLLGTFMCLSAADEATCASLCDSSPASARDAFTACVMSRSTTTCDSIGCYWTFNPSAGQGPTPMDVANCQMACDQEAFFQCISGTDQTTCRDACASETSRASVTNFIACESSAGGNCAAATACPPP